MPFTPVEHPLWFSLPVLPPDEDFTTGIVALVSEELDWSNQLLAHINEDLLIATYRDVPKFREDLEKDARLAELLATVGIQAGWLDRMLKAAADDLKKIILDTLKERLKINLIFHVGEDSTHPSKAELIYGLKVIYGLLSHKCPQLSLAENQRLVMQSQLLSGITACTPGFYNRVQEILQSLKKAASPPASIAVMLANIRSELVREAASRYRNFLAQDPQNHPWLTSNETHLYNQFTLVAAQQGYGVPPLSHYDPVQLGMTYVAEIRQVLADVFAEKYTVFDNLLALQTHIKSALAFFAYTTKKPKGDSYTIGQCRQFTAYLNQLCGLSVAEDSDEYLLKDGDGYWIDIDWPALSRKLWIAMEKCGYFQHSSIAHKPFFELFCEGNLRQGSIVDPIVIMDQLFPRPEDIIKCIVTFGLSKYWQERLLLQVVGPFLIGKNIDVSFYFDQISWQLLYDKNTLTVSQLLASLDDVSSVFSEWDLNVEYFWQYALHVHNFNPLRQIATGPLNEYFIWWQENYKVGPPELAFIIEQTPDDFAWVVENVCFQQENAHTVNDEGNTLLHYAVMKNHVAAVKLLIALGADISSLNNDLLPPRVYSNNPVIFQLLDKRQLELGLRKKLATQELEDGDDLTVIEKDYPGVSQVDDTLLMTAVKCGRTNSVKKLLAAGAPINPKNFSDESALSLAVKAGDVDVVELLLDALIPSTSTGKTKEFSHCLQQCCAWSVEKNQVKVFQMLHEKYAKQWFGNVNETLIKAVKDNSIDIVNAILASGKFNIDYICDGETALSLAAKAGNLAMVKALLTAGARDYYSNESDCNYTTPALAAAAKAKHQDIVQELLKYAPYVPLEMVYLSGEGGSVDYEEFPAEFQPLIKEASAKRAAVFAAIVRGDAEIDFADLPVDCLDSEQDSFLLTAVDNEHIHIVKTLLAKGADCEGVYTSPLILALEKKNYAIARELLAYGANSSDPTDFGKDKVRTAVEFILDNYKPDGLAFLIAICEENPRCWETIFGQQADFTHDQSPVFLKRIGRLVILASQDARIAKAIFHNKLHLLIGAYGHGIPVQEYLAKTAAGQQVLRHLEIDQPLSAMPAVVETSVKPSELKAAETLALPVKSPAAELPASTPATSSDPRLLSLPIKRTAGAGNCAFHAIFGRWDQRLKLMVDTQHSEHRQQLVAAVLATTATSHPQRYRLIQACVLAVIHETSLRPTGIDFKKYRHLQSLLNEYQKHARAAEQAWHIFREKVSENAAVREFIETQCRGYRNPSGMELTSFQDKYIHVMNHAAAEFAQLLTAQGLYDVYASYQTLSARDLSAEISAAHIAEYAKILGSDGQYLLAQEIHLLAEIFNKKIVYHLGVSDRTLLLDTFNGAGEDEVSIRHNGVNHFERLDDGRVMVQRPQRLEGKKAPLSFFAKRVALDIDQPQKTVQTKRKRADGDLSAHGKKGKTMRVVKRK